MPSVVETFCVPDFVSSSAPDDETILPWEPTDHPAMPVMFGQMPNIDGYFRSVIAESGDYVSGAFKFDNSFDATGVGIDSTRRGLTKFNASRISNIYNSNKMQPKALQVLPCIRT